jgi:hypothetical protein
MMTSQGELSVKKRIRSYLPAIGATLFVFLLAAVASAVPGDKARENVPDHVDLPATQGEEEAELEVEGDPAPQSTNNHGHCVSQAAKDDGVEGFQHGALVSSVAQDKDLTGEECDFSAQQEAAQSLESPSDRADAAGNGEGGRGLGQSKAKEARSKGGPETE